MLIRMACLCIVHIKLQLNEDDYTSYPNLTSLELRSTHRIGAVLSEIPPTTSSASLVGLGRMANDPA